MSETSSEASSLGKRSARLLHSKVLQLVLVALCVAIVVKRFLAVPNLAADSWWPMLLALDFLHTPGPHDLFGTVFFDWGIKFQYPPSSLLFLEPLYAVGLRSKDIFNGINFLFLVANAAVCTLIASRLFVSATDGAHRRMVWATVFVIGMTYGPIALGYDFGQIQIALNFLFSLACLLMLSGRFAASGIVMGIAAVVKPQFGPLLLVALLQQRWRFVASFLAATGILMILSFAVYGLQNHLGYLRVLNFLSERGESYHLNASINGIVNRLLNNGSAFDLTLTRGIRHSQIPPYDGTVFILTKVSMLAFIVLPFLLPRRREDRLSELLYFSNAAICFVMASPIAWTHHYGILLPAYMFALKAVLSGPPGSSPRLWIGLLLLSFMLTGGSFPDFENARGWATLLQVPLFFGSCLLVGILSFLIRDRSGIGQQQVCT
jgi:hypothetical protein